ncbi:YARHG domain-containing protein [Romboutsia hominis]|uniref:YARHG domain-containing protein n=1 Tax=Romboutsia hominis TaxID=1507512 RepID=UPI001F05C471|nr:DUF2116 family Zn-ribbon domain-containing protein [Romboutsia hominis]MCH1960095.1 DUF2116 family Zn-ribbon domain-containing protein [Romboutsia hominis]MCH1969475.1 DUF2116 family Zn-ribbon domain-containing protein [Romboutsia hominis]
MKTCKNCNNHLDKDQRFCNKCGYDTLKDDLKKNNLKNIIMIVVFILVVIVLVVFSLKDNIVQSYYIKKGDGENQSKAINYYIKALDAKYSDEVVQKLESKIEESENSEMELSKLKGIVKKDDLNSMYLNVYIQKAKENFNKENYKTTRKYLDLAKDYNYDIETFEYYEDLVAIENEASEREKEEKLDKAKEETKEKETVYIVENNHFAYNYDSAYGNDESYFIIPDSHIRYLSKEELLNYNKSQLGYIRNEIFARYGYIFKNDVYNNYFNSMPWYYPDSTFSGNIEDLNDIERYNIELIKSLE